MRKKKFDILFFFILPMYCEMLLMKSEGNCSFLFSYERSFGEFCSIFAGTNLASVGNAYAHLQDSGKKREIGESYFDFSLLNRYISEIPVLTVLRPAEVLNMKFLSP